MNFEQLVVTDSGEITAAERQFVACHNAIISHGAAASEHILMMCKNLKEMRDKKLYMAADFATFGEYSESACNIKERQAYNYIAIVENLPQEFLQLNAKMGITKLQLLASMAEETRSELLESDIADISVKALKEKIAELEAAQAAAAMQLSLFEAEKSAIIQAEKLKQNTLERSKLANAQQIAAMEKQIAELKKHNEEVQTVTVADAVLSAELRDKEMQIQELERQVAMSDALMSKFSVYFDQFQNICGGMNDIMAEMAADVSARCYGAVQRVLEGNNLCRR